MAAGSHGVLSTALVLFVFSIFSDVDRHHYSCILVNKTFITSENVIFAELSNYNISTWISSRKFELLTSKHVRTVPFLKTFPKSLLMLLLMLDGDVQLNPGPPKLKKKQEEKCYFKHFEDEKFECFNLKGGMHFIRLNARSLLPKLAELRLIASKSKASVIIVSETWMTIQLQTVEFPLKVTIFLGKTGIDREMVYAFARRTDIDNDNLDSVWLEL